MPWAARQVSKLTPLLSHPPRSAHQLTLCLRGDLVWHLRDTIRNLLQRSKNGQNHRMIGSKGHTKPRWQGQLVRSAWQPTCALLSPHVAATGLLSSPGTGVGAPQWAAWQSLCLHRHVPPAPAPLRLARPCRPCRLARLLVPTCGRAPSKGWVGPARTARLLETCRQWSRRRRWRWAGDRGGAAHGSRI